LQQEALTANESNDVREEGEQHRHSNRESTGNGVLLECVRYSGLEVLDEGSSHDKDEG